MEFSNAELFAGYGTLLFILTGLAIYYSEKVFSHHQ